MVYSLHFCRHFSVFGDKQPLLETVQIHMCPLVEELEVKISSNIQRFLSFSSWKENSNVPWCTMIIFSESRESYKLSWRSIASRLSIAEHPYLCLYTANFSCQSCVQPSPLCQQLSTRSCVCFWSSNALITLFLRCFTQRNSGVTCVNQHANRVVS